MSFLRGQRNAGGFPPNGQMSNPDPGRHSRDGWQFVAERESIQLQGKQYRHMKEWSRPCAICGTHFSIFEKSGAVDANSRFSNKTCEHHRGLLPAMEKGLIRWDTGTKRLVAGLMLGMDPTQPLGDMTTVEQFQMIKSTMEQEIACLNEDNTRLFAENKQLRAELVKRPFDPHKALANELAKLKGPW
jgi:hypothetical protein